METSILQARGLVKSYQREKIEIPVLRDVQLTVTPHQLTALVGRSGSGKSTLLHLLATLDQPDQGEVWFGNERIDNAPRKRRDDFRNRQVGMIFQFYHLLPELTALENVLTPIMIGNGYWSYLRQRQRVRSRAAELLERVGLGHRMHHRPREMSGGEMQRTAIARALISEPSILLADEPTGNLDAQTGGEILTLLNTLVRDAGLTIVMVTHDESIAAGADRVVRMANGRIEEPAIPLRKAS